MESQMNDSHRHRYVIEAVGVLALVFVAGAAIVTSGANPLLVAAATGVTFAGMWWLFGNRGQFNPALTIASAATRRTSMKDAGPILLSQLVGALVGGALLYAVLDGLRFGPGAASLASEAPTLAGASVLSVLVLEVLLTALFALVWMRIVERRFESTSGLALGAAYGGLMLASLPMTWSALTPWRALGPALFAGSGFGPFVVLTVASIVGGLLAAGVWLALIEPTRSSVGGPSAVAQI